MSDFWKQRREALGMSQHDVGVALGMTGAAVGSWERGETAPRLALLPLLARVYRVPEKQIVEVIVAHGRARATTRQKPSRRRGHDAV
jgi:transcriptional regulator with XRE-family HTH domain